MYTQQRAQKGGEVGTNGEFYEGGKFLPSTKRPKGEARRNRPRKVMIAPYTWVESRDGFRPIFDIVGVAAAYVDRYARLEDLRIKPIVKGGWDGHDIAELCEAWNRGERWMAVN
jgi:hypothetical protein